MNQATWICRDCIAKKNLEPISKRGTWWTPGLCDFCGKSGNLCNVDDLKLKKLENKDDDL